MKHLLSALVFSIGLLSLFPVFASSGATLPPPTAASAVATITEVMNNFADLGIIDQNTARYRIGLYSDNMYRYGMEINSVLTGSEEWARNELANVIEKRLVVLRDQWFLTSSGYTTYSQEYSNRTKTGSYIWLSQIYKDFKNFEQKLLYSTNTQDSLYADLKTRVATLLSERKITKEQHDKWLVKLRTQIYEYKSEPEFVTAQYEDQAANYTTVLPEESFSVSGDSMIDAYYKTLKKSSLKRLEKLSKKSLQTQLARAKKQLTKYQIGSKTEKKQKALILLLEEIIAKK